MRVGLSGSFGHFCSKARKAATLFALMQNVPKGTLRYLEGAVTADLQKRMVFVAGPRQVGKTTLARRILAAFPSHLYLNWDNQADRGAPSPPPPKARGRPAPTTAP